MIKKKIVDVIIPAYNCGHIIEKSVDSILEQNIEFNLFIKDDCSKDNTLSVIKKYNNDNIYIDSNKKNIGNLKTINALLEKTTSNYVAFQDADDWSNKDRINKQLEFIKKYDLDFCFTNFIKTSYTGEKELYCGVIINEELKSSNANRFEDVICFASIVFKRKIYEKIGGFDEYFDRIGGADIDWFYRAINAGFRGRIMNTPLYYYRDNLHSFTNSYSLKVNKYISPKIAHFFFEFRKLNTLEKYPPKRMIKKFISEEFLKINFDNNANTRKFIAQQTIRRDYFTAFYHLFSIFIKSPFKIENLKLLKFMIWKIRNND